jgi:flagellar biosynthesis GTPase FlhF
MFKKKEKLAEPKKDLAGSGSRKDSSKSDREDEDSAQLDKLDDKKSDQSTTSTKKDSSKDEIGNSNGKSDLSDSLKKKEERKRQDSIDQGTGNDVMIRIDSARSVKDKKKSSRSGEDHASSSKASSRSLLRVEEQPVHIHRESDEKIEAAAELAELDSYPLDKEDAIKLDAAYNYFSADFIKAVNKVHEISRSANGQVLPPEIVLIGPTSHGKSALLEALIGKSSN